MSGEVKKRYTLYGAETSYFTGKLRAYLRHKGIPFDEEISSFQIYQSIILPHTKLAMIPVLVDNSTGEVMQDTAIIIDELERRHGDLRRVDPSTPKQRLVSRLLELIGDECLVPAAMHYRWSFPENRRFIEQEFGRISAPDALPADQREMAVANVKKFSGFLPPLGVTAGSIPFIEEEWLFVLDTLEHHFATTGCRFLLGDQPCLGDFGLIGPMYAHLFRDPRPGQLMQSRAPLVADYVERVEMISPERRSYGGGCGGEYFADDAVPPTILPLLTHVLVRNYLPLFAAEMDLLRKFLAAEANNNNNNSSNNKSTNNRDKSGRIVVPRALGMVQWRICGATAAATVVRGAQSFHCFKLQRCIELYGRLSSSDRSAFDAVVPGASGFLGADVSDCRLAYVNYRLSPATGPAGPTVFSKL